ncbi:F-box protein At3g07870-like [Papaver somniferum]|uniref:F-box protein At3g07870-like n=1 Tax=Papaver somniferum TaxID=3469 RepID=UPI000E6F700A|nr:F-box protein At3g07870-like [Papaver somniferum]
MADLHNYTPSAFEHPYYIEYDETSAKKSSQKVTTFNLYPPFDYYQNIIGSCNGLICLDGLKDECLIVYVCCICNPITRECVFLPKIENSDYDNHVFLVGFGYICSTNEYKVVRAYRLKEEPKFVQFVVYTLGSGKGWRSVGKKIGIGMKLFTRLRGVFANGSDYWNLGKGKIVAFDLVEEFFVKLPRFSPGSLDFRLGVLEDYLCITHKTGAKSADIWLFKQKNDNSFSWSKEFSLINTSSYNVPLGLTSSGTVLCHDSSTKFLRHDLKSSSSKKLLDFGKQIYQAIPHMNTLVSLKALGEEDTKTMESGENVVQKAEPKMTLHFSKTVRWTHPH